MRLMLAWAGCRRAFGCLVFNRTLCLGVEFLGWFLGSRTNLAGAGELADAWLWRAIALMGRKHDPASEGEGGNADAWLEKRFEVHARETAQLPGGISSAIASIC